MHALALAPGGGLYVGTSPDGRDLQGRRAGQRDAVLRSRRQVHLGAGEPTPDGTLFAATGDKGLIYSITPDGKGAVFYRTKATHVRSAAARPPAAICSPAPNRPAGCSASTHDGTGFLLLDSSLQEISALRPGPGGVVYAAALSGQAQRAIALLSCLSCRSRRRPPVPTVIDRDHRRCRSWTSARPTSSGPAAATRAGRASGKGAVYRIQPDGVWDQVWTSADDAPYDVALDRDGALLVATGSKGKIYRVAGEPRETTLLARAPAQQVTSLHARMRGGLLVSTANPGKVFRLSATPAATGSYESDVRDAESVATWGAISWRGTVPGGTRRAAVHALGQHAPRPTTRGARGRAAYRRGEGEQITSPKARYLQWKLELTGASGREPGRDLGDRRLPAAQPAARDHVDHDSSAGRRVPEAVLDRRGRDCRLRRAARSTSAAPAAAQLGRRHRRCSAGAATRRACRRSSGRRRTPTTTTCSYDVLYRREGETTWKALKRNLTGSAVRVGHDVRAERHLRHQGRWPPTRRPTRPAPRWWPSARATRSTSTTRRRSITVAAVTRDNGRTIVRFTVKDADSPVQRVEYSLDADRWRPIYPKDGIADSRTRGIRAGARSGRGRQGRSSCARSTR